MLLYVLHVVLNVCCTNIDFSRGDDPPLDDCRQLIHKTLKMMPGGSPNQFPRTSGPTEFLRRPLWCKRRRRFIGSDRAPVRSSRT